MVGGGRFRRENSGRDRLLHTSNMSARSRSTVHTWRRLGTALSSVISRSTDAAPCTFWSSAISSPKRDASSTPGKHCAFARKAEPSSGAPASAIVEGERGEKETRGVERRDTWHAGGICDTWQTHRGETVRGAYGRETILRKQR